MIRITCPNNNIPERTYSIDVLFKELLGLKREQYDILFDNHIDCYLIKYNDKTIVIEDHFFIRYPEPLSYLSSENLPKELKFFHGLGLEIPILYGVDKFICDGNKTIVGIDVFASTFFMLTRWEEFLLGREENGDCDENELFCVKKGIFTRPIVHEYEKLIKLLLIDSDIQCDDRKYKVVMSHDVDGFLTPSFGDIIKSMLRQLRYGPPKNKVLNLTWQEKIKYKQSFPNAICQFELYAELCRNYNIPEWFYFKVCNVGEKECTYKFDDKQTKEVVRWLKNQKNDFIIPGFHPSQSTFENEKQWDKEIERIKDLLCVAPQIGRNHHLLYNQRMLRMWEKTAKGNPDSVLEISNCVFHNHIGFRSGVASPYHLFDLFERRPMKLREHPCQIMDTVIRYHRKKESEKEIWNEIETVVKSAKEHECELVLTWHIYIRNIKLIFNYFKWCQNVVKYAVNQ